MSDTGLSLVPGRSCGECSACCQYVSIDAPEMTKHDGVLCRHYSAGCTIYDKRPGLCRDFFCGWRHFPLSDQWRPDRCGFLLIAGADETPDGRQDSVRIHLFGKHERILWPPLISYIGHLLQRDVPVFLSVPGPRGFAAARVFLSASANVHNAFASNDPQAIAAVLMDCVQICVEHPKERAVFVNKPKQTT